MNWIGTSLCWAGNVVYTQKMTVRLPNNYGSWNEAIMAFDLVYFSIRQDKMQAVLTSASFAITWFIFILSAKKIIDLCGWVSIVQCPNKDMNMMQYSALRQSMPQMHRPHVLHVDLFTGGIEIGSSLKSELAPRISYPGSTASIHNRSISLITSRAQFNSANRLVQIGISIRNWTAN